MALVYDGAGGLFDRIGAIYRFIRELRKVGAQTGTADHRQSLFNLRKMEEVKRILLT
jgi:hypothetical protein